MATKPRYKTKSNNYTTQKDYARLKKLLDDGAYVVCFVDYEPHPPEKCTFQQIALAHKDDFYEISAHGISYLTWYEGLEFSFEDLCELNNVEFIEPTAETKDINEISN